MNVTLQSNVLAEWVNPLPMHVISNDSNFINNREELNTLSNRVLQAFNEGEKRFEIKKNAREYSSNWIEKIKINKRDISVAKSIEKKTQDYESRYECQKYMKMENWLPETNVELDSGNLAYARKINDYTVQDNNGITPLMEAVSNGGPLDEIRYLLSNSASVNVQDKQNNTALMWLLKSLNHADNERQLQTKLEIMENLLLAGANLTLAGTAGFTPMMYAIAVNNVPAFKMSFRSAEDFRCTNDAGETSLHLALKSDADPKILKVLIDLYKFMNVKDKNGYTPFMIASFRARHDIMDTFLSKGGNINDTDAHGWTALMHAVNCGDEKTVNYLLGKGANVLIEDCCHNDALLIAREQGKHHMVNLLQSKAKSESAMMEGVKIVLQQACENECGFVEGPDGLEKEKGLKNNDDTRYEIIDTEHRDILSDVAASTASRSAPINTFLIAKAIKGLYDGIRNISIYLRHSKNY